MEFIENKGQWDKKITYRTDFRTGSFFLEKKGFTVLLHNAADMERFSEYTHGHKISDKEIPDSFVLHSFSYNVSFLGASASPEVVPDKPLDTYNNYFIGNNQAEWASRCKVFTAVTYKNVYPNIDVRYYSAGEQLKYDFIVRPGGNPSAIALRYDGVTSLQVKNKELIIGTPVGDVKELEPYSYQTNASGRSDVKTVYTVKDNVVSFNAANYDDAATLVIDPQLIFSTLTGSPVANWGYTATPGPDGTFFAGGIVFGPRYPTSTGGYQTTFQGGNYDIGIFKYSANGNQRLYATYLGGSSNEQPHSLIADASGNLIIAGRSNSTNYPSRTSINASGAGYDIIITKLNADGTNLIGSVRIGGSGDDGVNVRDKSVPPYGYESIRRNYGDDARSEVILDAANNVILVSCTRSSDFPLSSALQTSSGGAQDGVILKLKPDLSGLLFSTYFGGAADDACFVVSIDPITNNLFIGGATLSSTLPGNTSGVMGTTSNGSIDGFVTSITPTGSAILKTSFIGTGAVDLIYGLKFDKAGFPYIMGTTTGNWTRVNAPFFNSGAKHFIAKLKPDLSAFIYSTLFGKNEAEPCLSPIAFLVDRCENVYVSGWGGGINTAEGYSQSGTTGLPEVNPITGIPPADGKDMYFFVLRKDAQSQLFGSHFGQFGGFGDHVDGGTSRFDANGIIYQAICANCGGRNSSPPVIFPTTPGAWARINGSSECNQASVKILMNFAGIGAEVQSAIDGVINDTLSCIPFTVDFKDLQKKGVTYYWNFNSSVNPNAVDQTTTTPQASFTFTAVGTYRVRLISEDLSTCNLRDTSYITIRAGDNRVTPKFSKKKREPCTSTTYDFTNLSFSSSGSSFGPQSFVWNFGDGSLPDTAISPAHTYPGPGTYFVKLTVIDPQFCNNPVTVIDTLRLNSQVVAKPASPALGCAPYTARFTNNSLGGLNWLWQFGDPASGPLNTSTDFEPTHLYQNIGTYQYRLIAYDSTTCNKVDTSAFFTIKVVKKPVALFDWAPNPPQANIPVSFTNLSQFADSYLWNFGDGENSTLFEPVHEYNATRTYNPVLIAYSIAGCTDTFSRRVDVLVNPLLDVPNAFTPGRFGVNSVINVTGFGIDKMDWKIYNRWGQLVFHSANKKIGWDGYYKGKLQPVEVYGYTLDVEYTDGKKLRKTGDITLLR